MRLLKDARFRPFVIIMDSGQRILIRRAENIAYDSQIETVNCYALSDGIMHILPWSKVAHVPLADSGEPLPHDNANVS